MIATDRLERAEHDSWEDLYRACPADLAASLGLKADRIGGALYLQISAVPLTQFNRLCGLGAGEPEPDLFGVAESGPAGAAAGQSACVAVAAALQRFRDAGVGAAWFQVAPGARQAAIESDLRQAGMQAQQRRWVKFQHGPQPAPPVATELAVTPVDRCSAALFASTVVAGFGMPSTLVPWLAALPERPGWRCFLASAGAEAVAGAAMRCGDGIGWLGLGATRPEFRRRGAQSALLAARIAAGLEAGLDGFATETGLPLPGEPGPSFANIQRAGFAIAYERTNWAV